MNTAEYLIRQLEKLDITDIFGLPGDYNFNILYAIENNSGVNWVGCTNELNAGYAADGYARVRGFGALLTTYGVGELSAMNSVAGSFAENVPVIHIVGMPDTKSLENNKIVHHGFYEPKPYAYAEAYKNVTEYAVCLNRDNAKIEIDKALKIFVRERRPVYLAIPSDIAVMDISDKETDFEWYSDYETLKLVTDKIAEKIKEASNPVVLADALINRYGAEIQFREFAEESGIPAVNFLMGTGIVNCDMKNYIGTYFSKYANPDAKRALDTTDCLISVGAIYGDANSYGENLPYEIKSHIAIYGTYTFVEGIKYDNVKMSDVLEKVTGKIQRRECGVKNDCISRETVTPTQNKIGFEFIYKKLQEFIKENDIVIADTGTVTQGLFSIKFPHNTKVLSQMLWCSIGWALPATFGAGIAKPDTRIILITGDGAHQISALEIGNMFRYFQKPVIIVLNNDGYTIERKLCSNPDSKFNDIVPMDYTKFARSFKGDIWTAKVETEDDFDKALRVTQIMDKLCYIEVCTDRNDVPELAQKVYEDISSRYHNSSASAENTSIQANSDNQDYRTFIHTSLKDFETEN